MPNKPLFAGLVVDEADNLVETAFVGSEPCYVVDDFGFRTTYSRRKSLIDKCSN